MGIPPFKKGGLAGIFGLKLFIFKLYGHCTEY